MVKNTYDRNINITIEVSQGNTFSENKDIDISKCVVFEKYSYFIPAGKTIEIPYTVYIQESYKGSVSAIIKFSENEEKGETISISISVPIYIIVAGTENINFNIDCIKLYSLNNDIYYKLVLENKGNVHIRHTGNIEIYSKNKTKLLKIIPIAETVPVYCEQKREFNEKFLSKTDLPKGEYIALFKINALNKEVTGEIKFEVSELGKIVTQRYTIKDIIKKNILFSKIYFLLNKFFNTFPMASLLSCITFVNAAATS